MNSVESPRGSRLHIGIFGRRNAGKSSLINALTGQDLAIVSSERGTTADPVFKSMEFHPIGPVVFIDTAGFDDEGELGSKRVDKTREMLDRTDIAIVVTEAGGEDTEIEDRWIKDLESRDIPVITVTNKIDLVDAAGAAEETAGRASSENGKAAEETADRVSSENGKSAENERAAKEPIAVSAVTGEGMDELRRAIVELSKKTDSGDDLLGDLVKGGELVLLVMPQDIQAPKGRLILPQVQTIRALLDKKCSVVSATADGFRRALNELSRAPDLIITDSQCFGQVWEERPQESPLTSFSILMAQAKGDIEVFIDGAKAIDDLAPNPRILIAEACTHVPQGEDIGTVKIPRMLRKLFGENVEITGVRGNDFPGVEELASYDLVIHCGACMFNRRHVMSRIAASKEAGTPITNYGVFLAKMNGILDKISI